MAGKKFELLAEEIIEWCKANELWVDCAVYFNDKARTTWKTWAGEVGAEVSEGVYEYNNKDPREYFEYGNPKTLSMSFEGGLYRVLNAFWESESLAKLYDEFTELFKHHNVCFEQGNAWNLSVYKIS